MGTTILDIAERVGTSKMTVSQALRGVGRMAPETRERILRVAEHLGYRANTAAQAVSTGRFGCAALLLGTREYASTLPEAMLRGIHDGLSAQDLHLNVTALPDEKLTSEGVVPKILRNTMADGLLINYTHEIPAKMVELIRRYTIPSIWMNTKQETDCIYPDDLRAGQDATEHLLRLGHRRIAYVDYSRQADEELPRQHYSAADRKQGYEKVMAAAGLRPRVIYRSNDLSPDWRWTYSLSWVAAGDRPTAIVAYGNTSAIPVITAAMSLGLKIPRDLSVVCFSARPIDYAGPEFTTLAVPEYAVGLGAAEMLLAKLAAPGKVLVPRQVSFAFQLGATSAPPFDGGLPGHTQGSL